MCEHLVCIYVCVFVIMSAMQIYICRCHREVFRFLRVGVTCGCEQLGMRSGKWTIILGRATGTQLWAIFSASISLYSFCLQNSNRPISSLFVRVWEEKVLCQSISHTVEKWIWKHYYWMTGNNLKYKLLTQTYIVFKYVNSYFCQRKLGQWKK